MVSGRTADLTRCGLEGALEVDCLTYTLKLAQERGANMSCEVKAVNGLIAARQQNRCPAPPTPALPLPQAGGPSLAFPALQLNHFLSCPVLLCPALPSQRLAGDVGVPLPQTGAFALHCLSPVAISLINISHSPRQTGSS